MTTTISDEQVQSAEDAHYDYLCNYSLSQYTVVGPEAKDAMRAALEAYERARSPDPRVVELETALSDLLSWFPDKPDHSWRIKAGAPGADAAIAKARALVAAMENDTTQCHWCGSDPRATCHVCKRG